MVKQLNQEQILDFTVHKTHRMTLKQVSTSTALPSNVALRVHTMLCVKPVQLSLCFNMCICGYTRCGVYIVYTSSAVKDSLFNFCRLILLFELVMLSAALFIYCRSSCVGFLCELCLSSGYL